jgi:hypothetical protein
MTLFRFRLLASEVLAVQIGASGILKFEGRELVGDPYSWLVFDHQGGQSVWRDPEFRVTFEPMDDVARKYMEEAVTRCVPGDSKQ